MKHMRRLTATQRILYLVPWIIFFMLWRQPALHLTSSEKMLDFWLENEPQIHQLMEAAPSGYTHFYFTKAEDLSGPSRWAYENGFTSFFRGEDGSFQFRVSWVPQPPEGYIALLYIPTDLPPFPSHYGDPIEEAPGQWLWENLGMGGYIKIQHLRPNLFYQEAYLPT